MKKRCLIFVFIVQLALLFALVPLPAFAGSILTLEQYEQIADPTIDAIIILLVSGGPATFILIPHYEYWRLECKTYLTGLKHMVDDAMAQAITTHTIKNLKIKVKPSYERARLTIEKLKKDLKIYEEDYPDFKDSGYKPPNEVTDPARIAWDYYSDIKAALKEYRFTYEKVVDLETKETVEKSETLVDAEKTLEKDYAALNKALMRLLGAFTRARIPLMDLSPRLGHKKEQVEKLQLTMFGIEHMARTLWEDGKTPKKQLRMTIENHSKNLMFTVQVASLKEEGKNAKKEDNYVTRVDTRYPMVLNTLSRRWIPVAPKDKLTVRAITMGPHRKKILLRKMRPKMMRPDLHSLSKSPYYVGYEVPRGVGVNVSRWFPIKESYNWGYRGAFTLAEKGRLVLTVFTTDGKQLRGIGIGGPLEMKNDGFDWILPDTFDKILSLVDSFGWPIMEVTGEAIIQKEGPRLGNCLLKPLVETGSGKLIFKIEAW